MTQHQPRNINVLFGGTLNQPGDLALLGIIFVTPMGIVALFVWLIAWISFMYVRKSR